MPRLVAAKSYLKIIADHMQMAEARAGGVVSGQIDECGFHAKGLSEMFHDGGGDLRHQDEVTQPLKGFQEQEKTKVSHRTVSGFLSKRDFMSCRRIKRSEVARRDVGFQARIGGFLNGGQGIETFRDE